MAMVRGAGVCAMVMLLFSLSSAPRASAEESSAYLKGYVTMIDISTERNNARLWVAIEKGVKGNQEAIIDGNDRMFRFKLDLAREALRKQLPVKVWVEKGVVGRFALRLYP
jgi:hypothetical protein